MSITLIKTKREIKLKQLENALKRHKILMPDYIKEDIRFEEFSAGELIHTAHDEVQNMSILFSGRIFISSASAEGREFAFAKEQTLTLLGDLEYLSQHMVYASSVIARTDVALGTISFNLFDKWLEDKNFRNYVLQCVANKGYRMTASQGTSKFYKPIQKVVNVLMSDIHYFSSNSDLYVVNYTHNDLSLITGLSNRTINRAIQSLVQQKLIVVKRGKIIIKISDVNTLADML